MIYWFVGQPGSGKTTLARRLKKHFDAKVTPALHFDGDDLREIWQAYDTKHFTKEYRVEGNQLLQRLTAYIADQGIAVILSTVNPYRNVREEFKASRKDLKEIYVYTTDIRGRENFHVKEFEAPETNCITIRTGAGRSEDETFQLLLSYL